LSGTTTLGKITRNITTLRIKSFRIIERNVTLFHIDVTFEMRTSEYGEICISIDNWKMVAMVFISNGKEGEESKIAERQRERVCVCASVGRNPQQR
jgi:hypothetical protein